MQMFDCFSLQPCNMDSNEATTRALTDDREPVLPEPDVSEDGVVDEEEDVPPVISDRLQRCMWTVWSRLDCQDRTLV